MACHHGVVADVGIASCNGVIREDGISADTGVFASDGFFLDPCISVLIKIVIAFHIAAEHPGEDFLGQIPRRADAMQLRVARMLDVGNLVFSHRASPRSRLGVGLGDNSVSTYSETMLSAFW